MIELEDFDFISWKKNLNNSLFDFWYDFNNN